MPSFNGTRGGPWTALAVIVVTGVVFSCGAVVSVCGTSAHDEELSQSYGGLGVKDVVGPLMTEILKLRSQLGRLDSTLKKKEAHIQFIENELIELRGGRSNQKPADRGGGGGEVEEAVAADGAESETLSKLLEAELEAMSARARQLEKKVVLATEKSEQDHLYAQALKRRAQVAEQNAADLQIEQQRRTQTL